MLAWLGFWCLGPVITMAAPNRKDYFKKLQLIIKYSIILRHNFKIVEDKKYFFKFKLLFFPHFAAR
jgi:hypothetical protein